MRNQAVNPKVEARNGVSQPFSLPRKPGNSETAAHFPFVFSPVDPIGGIAQGLLFEGLQIFRKTFLSQLPWLSIIHPTPH
jgi:hypothetical protein